MRRKIKSMQYQLVDLDKKIYDAKKFSDIKSAVRVNLSLQIFGYGEKIIPLTTTQIKKLKFKPGRIIPK